MTTPAHEKIWSALSEAASIRSELIACLLPDEKEREKEKHALEKKRKAEGGEGGEGGEDSDDEYDSALFDDIVKVYDLAEKVKLYSHLCNFVSKLFATQVNLC